VIEQVRIDYLDGGGGQTVRRDTRLRPGTGETIDLHRNAGIGRIVVSTNPR
jgi:hypothetical protein